jgi:two-component system, NarL family, sensor histidine kinase DesK
VRVRLFPPEDHWFPILWPAYLALPLISLQGRLSAGQWVAEGATLAAFFAVYCAGHWAASVLQRWVVVGALVGLGTATSLALAPDDAIIFVYAAYFAGRQPRLLALAGGLALVLGAIGALTLTGRLGGEPAMVMTLLSVVVAAAQIGVRRLMHVNAELRQARREVERLAREAERGRIAQDLHDVVGQTLSLVVLKSQIASRVATQGSEALTAELTAIERISRDALAQMRAVVRGYRTEGVMAECANARAALVEAGVECSLGRPGALPANADATLALVLREAVTNVLRHSGARRCDIRFASSDEGFTLTVEDDGRGQAGAAEGNGVKGMRERLAAVGGRLSFLPRAGGGTTLHADVPTRGST